MSVENIGRILNISHDDFLSKAREIERLMMIKVPIGSLRKGEVCRPFVAVDLTCKLLQISLSKSSILANVPVTPKVYSDAYVSCQQLLNLVFPNQISIDSLALKYGRENIVQPAKSLVHTYLQKSSCLKSLEILHCAAFFVTSKHHQGFLARQKFVVDNELNSSEFKEMCDELETQLKAQEINFRFDGVVNETLIDMKLCSHQSTKILAGSSLRNSAVRSASPSISTSMEKISAGKGVPILPLSTPTDPDLRYRSNQSKRVVETMNLRLSSSNMPEVDDELVRKKQFTEKIYKLWKNECQTRLSHQSYHQK